MDDLDYDLVAKLRQARADVNDLRSEVAYLKSKLVLAYEDIDLLLLLIPKIVKGYDA